MKCLYIVLICVVFSGAEERLLWHKVTTHDMATTIHTHVAVMGTVELVKKESDGDIHIRLCDKKDCIVAEIIPVLPLSAPRKGEWIQVRGIARIDKKHKWPEVHPVIGWSPVLPD